MKTNNILIGILGGVVTGLALGLLFAPNKGKKLEKKSRKNQFITPTQ